MKLKGIIPDPSTIDPITGQPFHKQMPGEGSGMEGMGADPMEMGEVPAEPDLEAQAQKWQRLINSTKQTQEEAEIINRLY